MESVHRLIWRSVHQYRYRPIFVDRLLDRYRLRGPTTNRYRSNISISTKKFNKLALKFKFPPYKIQNVRKIFYNTSTYEVRYLYCHVKNSGFSHFKLEKIRSFLGPDRLIEKFGLDRVRYRFEIAGPTHLYILEGLSSIRQSNDQPFLFSPSKDRRPT
jgi:hypothetical protein